MFTTTSQIGRRCCGKVSSFRDSSRPLWKGRRLHSTQSTPAEEATSSAPTRRQLFRVFWHAAVPMIGFGIMDQTVMLQAGNAIDCSIGVIFGLSTLSAAAIGQICSDASGVVFGGTVERLAKAAGLPSANLTAAQSRLPIVAQVTFAGSLCGIIMGCTIGLVNLLFIDTSRSSSLKLQALDDGEDVEYTVEASNDVRPDVTVFTVKGPDKEGVLASMTTALTKRGCTIIEVSAKLVPLEGSEGYSPFVNDVFYVVDKVSGEPLDDDELEEVARNLLESTKSPLRNIEAMQKAAVQQQLGEATSLKFPDNKTFERRMTVVRQNTTDQRPPSTKLMRRITVINRQDSQQQPKSDSE
eukprot:Nitzschia sp. Nitz4//scaffold194_size40385//17315//18376//NITZ4_007528-RA/size40385-processed-gene-0.14-mRNA-1//-1//CDS//3329540328//7813//frame0